MKFPQLLTIVGLLCLGGLLSQVRDAVEPQAVASSKTAVVKTSLDSLDCDCGTDCKCHDLSAKIAELQTAYDNMLAEKTKTASFKASTGNGSSGGSTGKTAQVSKVTSHYETVVSSSGGGSTGRHPLANTVKGAALVAGKTVQATSNVVKGTIHTAAKVATAPVANYRARWTYPGTIEQHMATSHGVSVSGMSQSDLLAQHDAIHDTIGTTYSTSTQTSYSSSSCPGGVCPSGRTATASRPGLLGRIFRR
jgi:hypothetical protein